MEESVNESVSGELHHQIGLGWTEPNIPFVREVVETLGFSCIHIEPASCTETYFEGLISTDEPIAFIHDVVLTGKYPFSCIDRIRNQGNGRIFQLFTLVKNDLLTSKDLNFEQNQIELIPVIRADRAWFSRLTGQVPQ